MIETIINAIISKWKEFYNQNRKKKVRKFIKWGFFKSLEGIMLLFCMLSRLLLGGVDELCFLGACIFTTVVVSKMLYGKNYKREAIMWDMAKICMYVIMFAIGGIVGENACIVLGMMGTMLSVGLLFEKGEEPGAHKRLTFATWGDILKNKMKIVGFSGFVIFNMFSFLVVAQMILK